MQALADRKALYRSAGTESTREGVAVGLEALFPLEAEQAECFLVQPVCGEASDHGIEGEHTAAGEPSKDCSS